MDTFFFSFTFLPIYTFLQSTCKSTVFTVFCWVYYYTTEKISFPENHKILIPLITKEVDIYKGPVSLAQVNKGIWHNLLHKIGFFSLLKNSYSIAKSIYSENGIPSVRQPFICSFVLIKKKVMKLKLKPIILHCIMKIININVS